MTRPFFTLLVIMLAAFKPFCQVSFSNYSSLTLPDSIKKNANAVYRLDEGILDIKSAARYTFTTHKVITLLNKDAAHHLQQSLYYSKMSTIENIVFKIYNSAGGLIRTYQKKDFDTRNYTGEMALYTDDKVLYLQAASPGYPCTIEIICEEKATGYITPPDWLIASPDEAVEYSSFIVKTAPLVDIKYRAINIDLKPSIENIAGVKWYTWIAKDILASKAEPYTYTSYNLPKIEIVAAAFEYDGYKGELKSWRTFGAWVYELFEDVKAFNQEDIQKIQTLVAACKTDREKIKTLYTYLEQNMRYVSIQLGIGGFKPFPVKYVNEKKIW